MSSTRTAAFFASALIALAAVGLATASVGLHRAGDPLVLPAASPTTIFASSHPAAAANAHLDPETSSETVLCLVCLQQLERKTTLLAPYGSLDPLVPSPVRARALDVVVPAAPFRTAPSRAPPRG